MKIKRRYLLPLVYIVADAFSLLFLDVARVIPVFLSSLSAPSAFVVRTVSTFAGASDPAYLAYFVIAGTIFQMFLLGIIWELLIDRVSKLLSRKQAVA